LNDFRNVGDVDQIGIAFEAYAGDFRSNEPERQINGIVVLGWMFTEFYPF
jgi:hypothetical protein